MCQISPLDYLYRRILIRDPAHYYNDPIKRIEIDFFQMQN